MKSVYSMSYSEFCLELSEDTENRFQVILDYDDFQVIHDDASGDYFYLERGENDASDFFPVIVVALLRYDVTHDLKIDKNDAGEIMSKMFDCVCCGEMVSDDDTLYYVWFDDFYSQFT